MWGKIEKDFLEWFEEICDKLGGVYKCSGDKIKKMLFNYN